MDVHEPHVAWPAPGCPVLLLAGATTFDLVLVHRGLGVADLRAWGSTLALGAVDGSWETRLEVATVEPVSDRRSRSRISEFLALPRMRDACVSTLRMRPEHALEVPTPRTVALFDLRRAGATLKPRAVAAYAANTTRLRLAFASDLHQAAAWDPIIDAIRQHGGAVAERVVDPRRLLALFVEQVNALHGRGALDLVVLGGDLVDHVRADPVGAGGSASNVERLLRDLSGLHVPTFAIPGNHDHRWAPWRPRTFGLDALGLTWAETRRILRAAGMWRGPRFRWADRQALRTHGPDGEPALAEHLRDMAPCTDFSLTLHDLRLVFVSTGRDALTRLRTMEPRRLGILAHAVAQSWRHPSSEGLDPHQIHRVRDALRDADGAAVFLHAPPVTERADRTLALTLRQDEIGHAARPEQRLSFERRLQREGLRCGTFLRNPGPFLGALLSSRCPATCFSGHVHRATALALDRKTRHLGSTPFAPVADPDQRALLVTAPSLAEWGRTRRDAPGFLIAEFDRGRLARLERRDLVYP